MRDSVDRPAPESTTTSPSATSRASAERWSAPIGTVVGADVTRPSSPGSRRRAATSGELAVEPGQHLPVHPRQPLRREGALEEAADPAGALPGGPDPHG